MFRLIYRQRRRHLFGAFFAALSFFCFSMGEPDIWWDDELSYALNLTVVVVTCVIMGGAFACLSALFVLIVPSCRIAVELVALMAFVQVSLTPLVPGYIVESGHDWLIWVVLWFGVVCTAYGTVLDRFRIWLDHSETRDFELKGSPEELWDWLVPGLARAGGSNWEPLLKKMEERADAQHVFDVEYCTGHAQFEHQTIKYEAVSYPHHARYSFQGELNPANKNLVQGTMAFTIEPLPGTDRCRVMLTRTRASLLVREGLMMWFDDALGDQTDHIRASWNNRWDWSMAGKFRRHAVSLS